jgi:hypothetical protein
MMIASVQIKWRIDGRWQSETFTDAERAVEFRSAVEKGGNRWPSGWIKGHGWRPTPPPARPAQTFAKVAHGPKGYFERQAKRARLGHLLIADGTHHNPHHPRSEATHPNFSS